MDLFNYLEKINIIKKHKVKRNILKNSIKAFLSGGIICALSEAIFLLCNLKYSIDLSKNITIIIIILISVILTSLNIYDKIAQECGCGLSIPITGFANTVCASALEGKSEKLVNGILLNMLKMSGAVICVSIITGVSLGLIKYFGGVIFG